MKIKGKEVSEETIGFALDEYFAKHPEPKPEPPKLRHGDYGLYSDGNVWIVLSRENRLEIFGGKSGSGFSPTDEWPNIKQRLGNIFDDLKRNKVDLEEFEVNGRVTVKLTSPDSVRITVLGWPTGGTKVIEANWNFWEIDDVVDLHQKLGQMITTAKRKSK